MNALLISALFATLAGSNEFAAQTDTIDRYVIDGQTITAFDGSQLVSKTIVKYDIDYKNTTDGVIKEHNIKTRIPDPFDMFSSSSSMINTEGSGISSTTYKSSTWESGSTTSSTYKSDGFSAGFLKGAFKDGETPLIVVDDEVFTGSIEDIDSENVRSITVLKGKVAETIWGEKGKNGVIDIKTKK
ncbi:MAG: hypothetical protein IK038_11265 [Bacteroidaceae bacterium]|nr:hypothetical protein [Bacteroidaceae bacterium]